MEKYEEKFYLVNYLNEDIAVTDSIFAYYIGILRFVLNYDLLDEIKYLDVLGGKFRCFYYIDSEGFKQYVGFNNVEV